MRTSSFLKAATAFLTAMLIHVISVAQNALNRGTSLPVNQVFMINNNPVPVEDLVYSDALGANGSMTHTVTFNINLYEETPGLTSLLAALQKQSIKDTRSEWSFSILSVNSARAIVEQRNYSAITVQEFSLTALDATQTTNVKGTVRLTAANMNVSPGIGKGDFSIAKLRAAVSNRYKLILGSLPGARVSQISSLQLRPTASGGVNFTITVGAADATAWNQAFLNGTASNMQGSIQLLSQDAQAVIKTITLTDAKITSFTGNGAGGKAQVVVNARGIAIQ